jgi:hypothetical protein
MSDFAARTEDEWSLKRFLAIAAAAEAGPAREGPNPLPPAPPPARVAAAALPPAPPREALGGGGGFVEVERVVSGAGIANCYAWAVATYGPLEGVDQEVAAEVAAAPEPAAVITVHGSPTTTTTTSGGGGGAAGVVVVPARCGLCARAVDAFLFALGAEAANLALRFQATGGVFIAGGGVGPKLLFGLRRGDELGHVRAPHGSGGDVGGEGSRGDGGCGEVELPGGSGGAAACRSLVVAGYLSKARSWPAYAASCPLVAVATGGDQLAMRGVAEVARRRRVAAAAAAPTGPR